MVDERRTALIVAPAGSEPGAQLARELGRSRSSRLRSRRRWRPIDVHVLRSMLTMPPSSALGGLVSGWRRGTRTVRRAPLFSVLVLLTILTAVGANLVVFTLARAIWIQPSPVVAPERLVVAAFTAEGGDGGIADIVPEERFQNLRRAAVFDDVAGQVNDSGARGDVRPRVQFETVGRPMEALAVTPNYFSLLGLSIRGRDFRAADDAPDALPVAIISDRLWHAEFQASPDVIGRTVRTSYEPVTIVGIAPRRFHGARLGEQVDVWIPRGLTSRMSLRARAGVAMRRPPGGLVVLARLRVGVSAAEAERAVDPPGFLAWRLMSLNSVIGVPGRTTTALGDQDLLAVAIGMASLVLVAGFATLMALTLVHVERRRRELAVRLALGCGRVRLARGVIGEMMALALIGTVLALVVTTWVLSASRTLSLPAGLGLDRLDLSLDWQSILVALTIGGGSIVAASLLGLSRVWHRRASGPLLSSSATPAESSLRLRRGLVAVHAASTVVVLVAAALFGRTVAFAFSGGAGIDVDHTAFVSVQPSYFESYGRTAIPFGDAREALAAVAYERLLSDLRGLPGVRAVALGEAPVRAGGMGSITAGAPVVLPMTASMPAGERTLRVGVHRGGAGYVEALGLPLLAGRLPDRHDAVLVTRSLADVLASGGNALGTLLKSDDNSYRVVGVVPDFIQGSMAADPTGGMIRQSLSIDSLGIAGISVVVRTAEEAESAIPRIADVVNGVFPLTARSRIASGRELLTADLGRQRLGASFFSSFGFVALVLGVGGMVGLVAYHVESRSRELGIRLALGATSRRLLVAVVRWSLGPVLAGTVLGLVAAAWFSGAAEALVYGVGTLDAASYLGAASLMLGSALLSSLAAGRRVRRVRPTDWLRQDD